MESSDALLVERTKLGMTLTMNRPDKRNTLSDALVAELQAALDAAEADPELRIVVLRGKDGCFCTGADLAEMSRGTAGKDPGRYMALLSRLSTSAKIVIAEVDG